MNTPDISVVIVSYNIKSLLLQCLKSIGESLQHIEIIVIDNNSGDGSAEAVRSVFPRVRLIENKINAGFPAANNQGFKIARGKYIFMLNPDTEVTGNAILKLKNYLDTHPETAIVGPKLLNNDGTLQYSAWRFPKKRYILAEMFYLNKLIGKKYYADKSFSETFEADSLSGAALMFRRELLEKVGMLNEYLFWIEDVDFCYRVRQKGMKVIYFPGAEIIHHMGQSARKNYTVSISSQVFNKIKFYRVHHSPWSAFAVTCISFANVFLRMMVFGLLSPFSGIYFRKAKAYSYTLFRVFNPPAGIR